MWSSILLLAVASSQCMNGVASHQLPDSFPRCKQADSNFNECLKNAVANVIPQLRSGIPSLGVSPLDPLQVTKIGIDQGQGPISVSMHFSNIVVKGLCDSQVHKSESDPKSYSLVLDGSVQKVVFEGDYEMNGRILLLPVTGKGRCKLTFTNMRARMGPKGKGTTKKGENYFDATEFPLDIYGLEKLEVHFDNLFNGDKTLGQTLNTLLNENWKDLWGELRPAFEQSFGAVFHQYTKSIFSKVAFKDIFLE